MLVIRQEQMRVFEREHQLSFEAKAFAYCATRSEVVRDEADLRERIHHYTEEAAKFNIENEDDVIRFIELRLYLGDRRWTAPEYAWVQEYLHEWSRASLRLDHVIERLRFDEGERA